MSFPNSNFEGNISTYVFGKSFWYYRVLKRECWTSRHIFGKKILNFFICGKVRILCKNVKYVCSLHFPKAITRNMLIGNVSFVFKYPVTCKQKYFKIHNNFIEINLNVCLLCAHHVMSSIILHTRRPKCQ